MKLQTLKSLIAILTIAVTFASCTKDDENNKEEVLPTEMSADNEWLEDDIVEGANWYKVTCNAGSTTATVEWAEDNYQGNDRDYSADVKVSAYQLDGTTPYFENEDLGYKTDGESFDLAVGEEAFLVKVEVGPTMAPGTYALRANSVTDIEVIYTDLNPSTEWKDTTIAVNEVVGFKVKCKPETKYKIMWAELGSPETGYSADINGSALNKDANEFYAVVENGSGLFQDKKKSYSDDAKIILTNADEKNFKLHLKGLTAGTLAIKVIEITE